MFGHRFGSPLMRINVPPFPPGASSGGAGTLASPVIAAWSIGGLLRDLAARGRHPAVVSFGEDGMVTWDSAEVADKALRFALGLRQSGLVRGHAVGLWAANSPVWIIAALAVLAAGGALVPIDDLADREQFAAALKSSNARRVITTAHHLAECGDALRAHGAAAILVDDGNQSEPAATSWRSLLGERMADLADAAEDEPAVVTWTSGTTGSPKAFVLTHHNIATNVVAVQRLAVVGRHDRALLPLPLHHAYPFVVGMLSPLVIGTTIVLPGGASGPLLMRALRDADVTTIVGVPRLYEALEAAIAARIDARGWITRLAWRALLRSTIVVHRATRLPLGHFLFAPIRGRVAPRLRLLVSGGARLDREIEERLAALGWRVLSGYGLAETASLFTCNRPNARRAGSVGRPLDGEVRIARPDDEGIGEIELRGSAITRGYLDNPEANLAAFTEDGWFLTGDLGFVDRDGFLFVAGRIKETLVLGGGRKVIPEDLERVYAHAPEIAELALLEDKGALVALVRPDPARLRERGATNIRDGIRVILAEQAQRLPSYQRLSGFALTNVALPRTHLGKFRRFLLPALYARALAGTSMRAPRLPTPEDEALLREPTAAAVWQLLRQQFPDRPLDLDIDLGLDLNLDSFGWMQLSILLHERLGVVLSETDLARIETIRDLLRLSIDRRTVTGAPQRGGPAAAPSVEYWLAPTGPLLTALGAAFYALNRAVIRGLFRLRVSGIDRLPAAGPFVIAPNHVSYLDPLVVAAALNRSRLRHAFWAGDAQRLFPHRSLRVFCRAVHLFPVDAMHPSATLEGANRILASGEIVVWFPEGWRSPDGGLQHFLPGIGQLLLRSKAPAVPALIGGTFAAWPRSRRLPRLRPLMVTFGDPAPVEALRAAGSGSTDEERVADALRRRLAAVAADAGSERSLASFSGIADRRKYPGGTPPA
jgi:long-chain acyl-CoA synthetase